MSDTLPCEEEELSCYECPFATECDEGLMEQWQEYYARQGDE